MLQKGSDSIRGLGRRRRQRPLLLLPTTYSLLPTTYYLLPTTYYLLPTTYYLLPATCYLLPATCYQPATSPAFVM